MFKVYALSGMKVKRCLKKRMSDTGYGFVLSHGNEQTKEQRHFPFLAYKR